MLRERRILEATYKDKLTCRRKRIKELNGESILEDVVIYSDIPCGLSLSDKSPPDRGSIISELSNEFVIFAAPDIRLNENDRVSITTSRGQTFSGKAGRSFAYESHTETILKIEEKV